MPNNYGSPRQSNSKVFALAFLLILALALLVLMKRPHTSSSLARVRALAFQAISHKGPGKSKRAAHENKLADGYNRKLRAGGTLESKFGVGTLMPSISKGSIQVPVVFKPEKKWCTPGDLDTILQTVKNKNSKEILVSLENMSTKTVYGKFHVSVKDLLKGIDRSFSVSAQTGSASLGLFICRDSRKTGSCFSKEVISHEDITKELNKKSTSAVAATKDYMFYFQNVLVSNGKLQIYRNANADLSLAPGLQNFLESSYKLKEEEFRTASKINSTIRSVPAMIINKKILLTLPYNDPNCVASF